MNQARMKQDHRSRRTPWRDNAAAGDQTSDGVVVDRPQRIAGGRSVVRGVDHAQLVAARDEHERAIELVDVVQKNRDVHRPRLRHVVVVLPSTEILMPLPDVAVEGHLAVDLELMHVHRLTPELPHQFYHPRVRAEGSVYSFPAKWGRTASLPVSRTFSCRCSA